MGIYDRDYYREPRPGVSLRGPSTVVGWLILLNVAIYVVDSLLTPAVYMVNVRAFSEHPDEVQFIPLGNWLGYHMAVHVGDVDESDAAIVVGEEFRPDRFRRPLQSTLGRPWLWWQLLTYGFAHAPTPGHIFGNMLVLFFFGRPVEARYGSREFLRLYLTMLVVGSLVWATLNEFTQGPEGATQMLVGASGAVTGVVILFALNYPHSTVLLMFLFPIPAWLLGILYVVGDAVGALGWASETRTNVAFGVHLAGAGFALLYYRLGWNLAKVVPRGISLAWLKPRPRLRVHDPDQESRGRRALSEEVDRILEKIHREGESSLTRKERRVLENASREYQKRRQQTDGDS
jgi:membrane associated rhomboid family serine protease